MANTLAGALIRAPILRTLRPCSTAQPATCTLRHLRALGSSPSTAAATSDRFLEPSQSQASPAVPAPAVTRPAHHPPPTVTTSAPRHQPLPPLQEDYHQMQQEHQQQDVQQQTQEPEPEHYVPRPPKPKLPAYFVSPHSSVKSAAHILLRNIENGQPIRVVCKPDCLLKALQVLALARSLANRTLGLDLGFQPFNPPMAPFPDATPTFVFDPSPPAPAAPRRTTAFVSPTAAPAVLQPNISSRLNRYNHVYIPDIHRNEDAVSVSVSLVVARKEALMRAQDFWLYPELSLKTLDGAVLPSVDLLLVKSAPPRQEAHVVPRPAASAASLL